MNSLPRDTVWHVARMCAIWGAISGSFNILHACIPLITRDIKKESAAQWLGIFMSTGAVCGAIFSVIGGFFSDFVGRMTLLRPWVIYYFVTVLAVIVAQAWSSVVLLLWAHTAALAIPTTIVLAYLSDFLRDASLVESYGYLSGSYGAANFVATLLCGVLNELYSRNASLILALALAGVALYLVLWSPPPASVQDVLDKRTEETRLRGRKDVVSREEFTRAVKLLVADRYLLLLCVAAAILRMANMNDHLMIVYFIAFRCEAGLTSISYILAIMALFMSLSQLVLLPFAVRRRAVFPTLLVSLFGMAVCVMSFAFCFTLWQFATAACLLGCTLLVPSIFNARISALSSTTGIAGVTLGAVSTITNTVEIVMAIVYGSLLEWSTQSFKANSVWSGLPFLLNGFTVVLAFLLVLCAEWRFGRKVGSWGAEERRPSDPVKAIEEDVSPAVPDSKYGTLCNRDGDGFAVTSSGVVAPILASTGVSLRPDKDN